MRSELLFPDDDGVCNWRHWNHAMNRRAEVKMLVSKGLAAREEAARPNQ